jgi:hypothetical protein
MEPTMNITRVDVRTRRQRPVAIPHGLRPAQVPRMLFIDELIARGLVHLAQADFRGRAHPAVVAQLGTPIVVRADGKQDEVEAFLRLPDGELVLIDAGHGHVWIDVAARTRSAVTAAVARVQGLLASDAPGPERVSIAFWMRDESGGDVRHREIVAPRFATIAANYPVVVRRQLQRLIEVTSPAHGRLILWRGAPGTGKSHALRALAREWSAWCTAHFIMDPEELLGRGGAYMLDLLSEDSAPRDRWRLVILEDAGELIATDARSVAGQALENGGLSWPHCGGLIWPHLPSDGGLSVRVSTRAWEVGRGDGFQGGAVRADPERPRARGAVDAGAGGEVRGAPAGGAPGVGVRGTAGAEAAGGSPGAGAGGVSRADRLLAGG